MSLETHVHIFMFTIDAPDLFDQTKSKEVKIATLIKSLPASFESPDMVSSMTKSPLSS